MVRTERVGPISVHTTLYYRYAENLKLGIIRNPIDMELGRRATMMHPHTRYSAV